MYHNKIYITQRDALLDYDPVTVEEIWVHWIHCHVLKFWQHRQNSFPIF